MKTILALTFSIFLWYPGILECQNLLDEGNKWYVRSGGGFSGNVITSLFKIEGEEIVNGTVYKVLYEANWRDTSNWYSSGYLLRRDSSNRIYYKYNDWEEELLYDFNMEIGDTVTFTYGSMAECKWKVASVDSIELRNGELRKRINIQRLEGFSTYNSYLIDGIGSEFGLVDLVTGGCTIDFGRWLGCFFNNDSWLWGNGNCFYVPVAETIKETEVKIFPNPFLSEFVVEAPNSEIERIEIFSGDGSLVLSSRKSSSNTKVDTQQLRPGFYFVKITQRNGKTTSHKILKIQP